MRTLAPAAPYRSSTIGAIAANDVRYLLNVRLKLINMLKREERWYIAQQCFTCLPTIVILDLMQYSSIFDH